MMQDKTTLVIKIIMYFINIFVIYMYICNTNKKTNENKKNRFSFVPILILSSIMGLYGLIAGNLSDRQRYGLSFSNPTYEYIIKRDSIGLYYLYKFMHYFSYDTGWLFFAVPFFYCIITLYSYNKIKDPYPLAILLLGLSTYSTFGYIAFKQCFAVALIGLSWAYHTDNKNKKSIICILLALLFHESALVMIPLYLCLWVIKRSKTIRIIVYILLLLSIFFYNSICVQINEIADAFPALKFQIGSYFEDNEGKANYLTAIKGISFYIITLYAFINRGNLKNEIKMYDEYLTICVFCSVTSIMSIYMYWMWRFSIYCYYPIFIFFSQIMHYNNNIQEKRIIKILVEMFLFIILLRYLIQCYFIYGGIY